MKRAVSLVASHLVVWAAGYAVHCFTVPSVAAVEAPAPLPEKPAPPRPVISPGTVTGEPGDWPWTAGECRKAWRALKGSKEPTAELLLLRDKIMTAWLAKDLHSALIAWTDEETLRANPGYGLSEAMAGHEEEMLDWIFAGDFGLDGPVLLNVLRGRGERD